MTITTSPYNNNYTTNNIPCFFASCFFIYLLFIMKLTVVYTILFFLRKHVSYVNMVAKYKSPIKTEPLVGLLRHFVGRETVTFSAGQITKCQFHVTVSKKLFYIFQKYF